MSVATAARSSSSTPYDLALVLCLATLWGASYSFIKVAVASIPPITLIAARTLIAGALLIVLLRLRGIVWPRDVATWKRFAVQAVLNSVVPFTLIAWGQRTVDAGLATILNATTPIFTFLLAVTLMRTERVTWRKLSGVGAGSAGVVLIVGADALLGLGQGLTAQLAIVAASLCYAGAALYGRNFAGLDPMLPAAGSLIVGAVMLVPLGLVVDRPWTLYPSADSLAALVALSVLSTALALVIYFRLVATIGSIGVTAQAYLRVPVGVGLGILFLEETLVSSAWVGLVLVIVSVAAMTMPTRRRTDAALD